MAKTLEVSQFQFGNAKKQWFKLWNQIGEKNRSVSATRTTNHTRRHLNRNTITTIRFRAYSSVEKHGKL